MTTPNTWGADYTSWKQRYPHTGIVSPLLWFFDYFTFSYPQFLIKKGKETIEESDFPPVEQGDSSIELNRRLTQAWNQEKSNIKPNLTKVVFKVFGFEYFISFLIGFIEMCSKLMQAIFLGQVVLWFQNPTPNPPWLAAGLLSLAVFLHAFCHHIMFYISMRVGFRLRVGFVAMLYSKLLRLSYSNMSGDGNASTGAIVNLISNDVQRFEDAAPFFYFILLAPIEMICSIVILWFYIGPSCLAGILVMVCTIPLQSFFAKQFQKFRKHTTQWRDQRISNTSDVLFGINVVKLYSWEVPFKQRLLELRNNEMSWIKKASVIRALNETLFYISPTIVTAVTLLVYWGSGNVLTPSAVFVSFSIFAGLGLTVMGFVPKAFQFGAESLVSLKRIQEFLLLPEIDRDLKGQGTKLAIVNGDFSWQSLPSLQLNPQDFGETITGGKFSRREGNSSNQIHRQMEKDVEHWKSLNSQDLNLSLDYSISSNDIPQDVIPLNPFKNTLSDISIQFPKGITAIVGPVGAGKTSLLMALLGEMTRTRGQVFLPTDKLSYTAQIPFVSNSTVKENILFGSTFDQKRMDRVIEMCQMKRDLELLGGLDVLVGERGIQLSGGQRARLALARCVYSNADLCLLDDVLAAVDTKVGKGLFYDCIQNYLVKEQQRTVVLVTHQLQFVKDADWIVVMENGKVSRQGTWNEILASTSPEGDSPFLKVLKEAAKQKDDLVIDEVKPKDSIQQDSDSESPVEEEEEKELETEKMQEGAISGKTYWNFFRAGANVPTLILLICLLFVSEALNVFTNWWVAHWSSIPSPMQNDAYYPAIYGCLALLVIILCVCRAVLFFYILLTAATVIFGQMVSSVLTAPMAFFQVNPHGRVLNRFSKDMAMTDELLPMTFFDALQCFLNITAVLVVCAVLVPWTLIAIPFMLAIFYYLRVIYIRASRQIKRWEAVTRSPIYSTISTSLEGLAIIRSFNAESRFMSRFQTLQDENTTIWFGFLSCARWLGFRLDTLCACLTTIVVFVCVALSGSLSSSAVGLVLSYTLQLVGLLQWAMRQSTEVENLIVSVERVMEYGNLESEAPPIIEPRPPSTWPEHGEVVIKDMSLTYPVTGQQVLHDISVRFGPGEKVGIVGRTGAGKSSMISALFRLVEPSSTKSVIVDGIPLSEIGLDDVRGRMSIIPQEPFLFSASFRFNVDPFSQYSDAQIWQAVEAMQLKPKIASHPDKLDQMVHDGGSNFSVGERQLICLCRAILKKSKLLILDEASSNIDLFSDSLIQSTIRDEGGLFGDATVLTIAHRLRSVIDYDKILVLDAGQVVEYDTPFALLEKQDGWFANMVHEMGPDSEAQLKEMAWIKEQERLGLRPRSGSLVARSNSLLSNNSALRSESLLSSMPTMDMMDRRPSVLSSYSNSSLPRNVRASKATLRRYSRAE